MLVCVHTPAWRWPAGDTAWCSSIEIIESSCGLLYTHEMSHNSCIADCLQCWCVLCYCWFKWLRLWGRCWPFEQPLFPLMSCYEHGNIRRLCMCGEEKQLLGPALLPFP